MSKLPSSERAARAEARAAVRAIIAAEDADITPAERAEAPDRLAKLVPANTPAEGWIECRLCGPSSRVFYWAPFAGAEEWDIEVPSPECWENRHPLSGPARRVARPTSGGWAIVTERRGRETSSALVMIGGRRAR